MLLDLRWDCSRSLDLTSQYDVRAGAEEEGAAVSHLVGQATQTDAATGVDALGTLPPKCTAGPVRMEQRASRETDQPLLLSTEPERAYPTEARERQKVALKAARDAGIEVRKRKKFLEDH